MDAQDLSRKSNANIGSNIEEKKKKERNSIETKEANGNIEPMTCRLSDPFTNQQYNLSLLHNLENIFWY